mmetsp:Transcript_17658/g.36669  ORF Transcript_17658/g.36669 Transcript_17658/m.36669 type:complete len:317 (-) Transcript_17658:1343-2293(-)
MKFQPFFLSIISCLCLFNHYCRSYVPFALPIRRSIRRPTRRPIREVQYQTILRCRADGLGEEEEEEDGEEYERRRKRRRKSKSSSREGVPLPPLSPNSPPTVHTLPYLLPSLSTLGLFSILDLTSTPYDVLTSRKLLISFVLQQSQEKEVTDPWWFEVGRILEKDKGDGVKGQTVEEAWGKVKEVGKGGLRRIGVEVRRVRDGAAGGGDDFIVTPPREEGVIEVKVKEDDGKDGVKVGERMRIEGGREDMRLKVGEVVDDGKGGEDLKEDRTKVVKRKKVVRRRRKKKKWRNHPIRVSLRQILLPPRLRARTLLTK